MFKVKYIRSLEMSEIQLGDTKKACKKTLYLLDDIFLLNLLVWKQSL